MQYKSRCMWVFAVVTMFLVTLSVGCGAGRGCKEQPCTYGCNRMYQPVCGCNGKTYSNSCEAECHGIKKYKSGACK